MLLTIFNNTQQKHNNMSQNVDILGQQYIAINIVIVWLGDAVTKSLVHKCLGDQVNETQCLGDPVPF
jgi:hypothetical protein